MNAGSDMTGIDGRFRRAGRLLSRHAVLQSLLVVTACLQLTVVGSVLLARSWVEPALLRQALPWTTLALLGLSGLWLFRARSPRRLRNRAIRLLVAEDPAAHADVHAYYADNLVGGIRDEAVREICRDRLAQHLSERGHSLPGFRLDALPLLGWLTAFALIWLLPWLWGFTPPRLVADFRRLLRLRTTPLTVLSFAPEREWLQPARSTALRVTFSGTPMEEVQALLTDETGQTTNLPLRASGDVYAASFVTPAVPFQLQLASENRLTPPRSYQVFPNQVVSLVSVEVLDGTGKVSAVHGPTDLPLTVRFGRRLRWHVQAAPCPLRAYGVGSRSAAVTRGAQPDVWESVAETDAEFFTFWEAHGDAPIVQDRFLIKVIPDAPPEVTLTAPPQAAGEPLALPMELRVTAIDDSAVLHGAVAVADLRGWQQVLPLELEPEGTGAKATLTLAEKDLEGRTGRYLMVWAVADDDGAPVNQGASSPRFYVLPDQQPPEPQPDQADPPPEEQPPAPEEDLAAALQENLDRMGQQDENPEEGEPAPADPQENAATPPAQGDPGKQEQGDKGQTDANQPGGQDPTVAQGDQGKDQQGQPGDGQADAQPGQPGGQDSDVAQGDQGKDQQGQPGDGQADAQPGQPGGQEPTVAQGDQGKERQDQPAEGQAEGNQPGGQEPTVAQGDKGKERQDQPAEGQAEGNQPGGQEPTVAQGDQGKDQPGQAADGQADAQPGQPGGQGDDVAQGDGQPGQVAEGQGEAQPGQGGNQPGQPGQGGAPGDNVAQGDGQPGQAAEGQGEAQPGQGGNQPGQPGQGGAPGDNVAQGDGQPGNPPGQPGGAEPKAAPANQAEGQPGQGAPAQGEVAQGGQGADQPGQSGAGPEAEPGGEQGEGAAKAPGVTGTEGTGEPKAEGLATGPGEGGGEGEVQPVEAHGGGADGAPPPVPPVAEGPGQAGPDTVDEALRQAAAQEGVAASEDRGAVLPAAGETGSVPAGEAPAAHGQWGPGQTADGAQVAVGDAPAPTEDSPAPERLTAAELNAETGAPLAEVDTTLVGAGGSGSRTALADSPVEQAIRAHEEAMRKLTGSEKAATREYYRRLKDIR